MTRLLVSVRSGEEARAAMLGGADLIDVKEPLRGSLGAADSRCLQEIAATICGRLPLSAAWGELLDNALPPTEPWLAAYRFVKLGLAGCHTVRDWPERWQRQMAGLPNPVQPVAVVYADWRNARAPTPDDVVSHAIRNRCGAVLFDTFRKDQGDVFRHLSDRSLQAWIERLRTAAIPVVLGGSLHPASIARAVALQPDYLAVRGAVCDGPRTGTLQTALVRQLAVRICQEEAGLPSTPCSDVAPFA
jgi:uncharacterized protein (UPF0264 family)